MKIGTLKIDATNMQSIGAGEYQFEVIGQKWVRFLLPNGVLHSQHATMHSLLFGLQQMSGQPNDVGTLTIGGRVYRVLITANRWIGFEPKDDPADPIRHLEEMDSLIAKLCELAQPVDCT